MPGDTSVFKGQGEDDSEHIARRYQSKMTLNQKASLKFHRLATEISHKMSVSDFTVHY